MIDHKFPFVTATTDFAMIFPHPKLTDTVLLFKEGIDFSLLLYATDLGFCILDRVRAHTAET